MQQRLSVPVGGARRVPDPSQVVAEREDGGPFYFAEGLGPGGLPAGQLALGPVELLQRSLPRGLQAPGAEAVLGVDRPVTALSLGGGVTGALHFAPELGQGGVVLSLELFGREAYNEAAYEDTGTNIERTYGLAIARHLYDFIKFRL